MELSSTQQRALSLANQICHGEISPSDVSDADWELLVLAAEILDPKSAPQLLACRVLENAKESIGYFSNSSEHQRATASGMKMQSSIEQGGAIFAPTRDAVADENV